jgi:hypothetical protein
MKIFLLCSVTILSFFVFTGNTQAQTIKASAATGKISACAGTASSSPHIQQFSVSGSELSANITVTAPKGFQVSLSTGSWYVGSLTLIQSGGLVLDTIVYVRLAAADAVNTYSGNIVLSSVNAVSL